MKKLKLMIPVLMMFGFMACQSNTTEEQETEEAATEIEAAQQELEELADQIENESEDLIHDIDSLLQ